jgi:hypothetical protein
VVAKLGNDLTAEQREQLIRLRWLWEKGYLIDSDGESRTARPRYDVERVITCDTPQELWQAIREDNERRLVESGRSGYWVETASGPPSRVDTSQHIRHGCSGPPHVA